MPLNRVCVFCGSSSGVLPSYAASARRLGAVLAAKKIGLVYGGGTVGLMGAVSLSCLESGGDVVGVIPSSLHDEALSGAMIGQIHVTKDMHERKALMSQMSDAFVALPGGLGTFEELFEVLTWAQLGFHTKPVAVLNMEGYFDGLMTFLQHSVDQGFIRQVHKDNLIVASDPEDLFAQLDAWTPAVSLIESIKSSPSFLGSVEDGSSS